MLRTFSGSYFFLGRDLRSSSQAVISTNVVARRAANASSRYHLPTGIVVTMQDERSQIQNRAAAMAVLQSRLLVLRHEEEAKKKKELAGDIKASWGDQMRSYVLHPYQMVKDLRTGCETSQTQAVFDGDIDAFIEAGIRWRHEQRRQAAEEEE